MAIIRGTKALYTRLTVLEQKVNLTAEQADYDWLHVQPITPN